MSGETPQKSRFLDYAVARISKHNPRKLPSRLDLNLLHMAWGNFGFMASLHYLKKIAEAAHETPGPILECGSGLTTLIMGLLTQGKGIEIYALEHHEKWQERMTQTMNNYGLDHVKVVPAPLKDFGEYDWYDFDKTPLPKDFHMVVCDGPPGNIKGSRYGLIPEMDGHLSDHCTILLDDAARKNERKVMEHWRLRYGFNYRMVGNLQKFAMVNRIVQD